MTIIYNLSSGKGLRLREEPIFFERTKDVQIAFETSIKYKDSQLTAVLSCENGKRYTLPLQSGKITLPTECVTPQSIGLVITAVKGGKTECIWEAEPIIIESLEALKTKLNGALPEYMALPLEVEKLQALCTKQQAQIDSLIKLINEKYAPTVKNLADKLKNLEEEYDLLKR